MAIELNEENTMYNVMTQSGKIHIDVARKRHLDYLQCGPYVVHNDNIVHSLVIPATDFAELIAQPDIQGLKLYFCREPETPGNICLSLIVIGYDSNGENIIINNEVLNNLDPCPDQCPLPLEENSDSDLNIDTNATPHVWCKPNEPGAAIWFTKGNEARPHHVRVGALNCTP